MVELVAARPEHDPGADREQARGRGHRTACELAVARRPQRQQRHRQCDRVEQRQQRLVARERRHGRPGDREGGPAGEQHQGAQRHELVPARSRCVRACQHDREQEPGKERVRQPVRPARAPVREPGDAGGGRHERGGGQRARHSSGVEAQQAAHSTRPASGSYAPVPSGLEKNWTLRIEACLTTVRSGRQGTWLKSG